MHLSNFQLDVIQELINIGIGRAASVLNKMASAHIVLQVPEVKLFSPQELSQHPAFVNATRVSAVRLSFEGAFAGTAALVFPPTSAANLISLLIGEDQMTLDMDSLRLGTLQEIGNIVLSCVMGSLGNILEERVDYIPPDYFEDTLDNLLLFDEHQKKVVLFVKAHFEVQDHLIEGDIMIIFKLDTFASLLASIDSLLAASGAHPSGSDA